MRKHFKDFLKEEDGIETIEFIGLVAVAAVLLGVIAGIGNTMYQTAKDKQSNLGQQLANMEAQMTE